MADSASSSSFPVAVMVIVISSVGLNAITPIRLFALIRERLFSSMISLSKMQAIWIRSAIFLCEMSDIVISFLIISVPFLSALFFMGVYHHCPFLHHCDYGVVTDTRYIGRYTAS